MSGDWRRIVSFFLERGYDIEGEDDKKVVLSQTIFKNGFEEDWETIVIFKDDLVSSYRIFETTRNMKGMKFCHGDGKWYSAEEYKKNCKSDYVLLRDLYPDLVEG